MKRVVLLAVAAALIVPPAAGHAAPRPGAPGIGDPYYPLDGNGGYDVAHYDLNLAYTPKTRRLSGVATITATATQALSRFNLDFRHLSVRRVTVEGRRARATRRGGELTITPRAALARGAQFTAVIAYDGKPKPSREPGLGSNDGWMPTDDGALVAGEPHGADTWFPGNDHPRDKATYTFHVSVPTGLAAIANGVLVSTEQRGARTIWTWDEQAPMASYLATATVGRFDISTRTVNGIQYWDAIAPGLARVPTRTHSDGGRTVADVAKAAVAREPEIIDFLAGIFGPYPFTAAGSIIDDVRGLGFALENQTRPIYSQLFFEGSDQEAATVIVHELAHQWVGDLVSLRSWRDIWLNEGFATFTEWLWAEHEGIQTTQARFNERMRLPSAGRFWDLKIGDPGPRRLFNVAVYERGAMTLQALRRTIGDEAFFRLLREWVSDHANGNATTGQFIALAERVSGRSLDRFFRTWLYTTSKPR